ncbi:MAG TPA: hypothetical protein VF768_00300 [Holophagaceae bacterium]
MRWSTLWLLAALLSLPLPAATPVPALVERAIQRLHQGKPEVASKVVTHVDVYDGKAAYLGSLETVDVLVAWGKDGKPVRKEIASHQQGSPGFTMSLSLHLEDSPAEALDGFDTWGDAGPADLQGQSVRCFRGTSVSGKDTTTALAYLDPQTGAPLRVDYEMPVHSTFGTRQVKATVCFGPGGGGAWVPQSATLDQAGRVMFWSRHLVVVSTYQDWMPRP